MEGQQAESEVDVVGVQEEEEPSRMSGNAAGPLDLCLASTLSLPEVWLESTDEVEPNVLVSDVQGKRRLMDVIGKS